MSRARITHKLTTEQERTLQEFKDAELGKIEATKHDDKELIAIKSAEARQALVKLDALKEAKMPALLARQIAQHTTPGHMFSSKPKKLSSRAQTTKPTPAPSAFVPRAP